MAKLDEIVETQKTIIAIQQAILKELGQIETLIIQNQIELRGTLASIYYLQTRTLDAVIQIKATDLNACTKFLNDRNDNDNFVPDQGRFRDYASMQDYFANNWDLYKTCRLALDESIASISGPHGIFFGYPVLENEAAKTRDDRLVQVLEPIKNAVAPFFAYVNRYVPDTNPDKKTIKGSFFAPSGDFETLMQKEKILGLGKQPQTGSGATNDPTLSQTTQLSPEAKKLQTLRPITALKYPDNNPAVGMFYANFSNELLSPDAVIGYANVELEINSYRELIATSGTTLLSSKDIYLGRGHKQSAEIALKAAFDWLTLAIAQQNFLGGDTLLPFLNVDGFGEYTPPEIDLKQLIGEPKSKDVAHDQQLALAHYLLGHNPVLLQNAIRYRIFARMSDVSDDKRLTAFGYAWAYSHTETPQYLQALLHDIVPVEHVEKKASDGPEVPATGWYYKYTFNDYDETGHVTAATQLVPLPPIEDVTGKVFVISTPLRRLLECRERINSLLSTDHLLEQASGRPTEFRQLKLMLLLQHYQPPSETVPGRASSGARQ